MTRMAGPDCTVIYAQIYKYTHIIHKHKYYIIPINTRCTLHREAKVYCHESLTLRI